MDLTAAEFRRVCINNNIFPRVPGNKFDGETAYYLKADVKALKRSNYVQHLFDQKVYLKKAISMKQQ